MKYSDAIEKLISIHNLDILDNTFLSRSILLDYISNSIYDKRLVDVFYNINKNNNIKNIFVNSSLQEGRKELENIYKEYKSNITKQEFVDMVNPISKVIYPIEYEKYNKNKIINQTTINKVAVVKNTKHIIKPVKINNVQPKALPAKPKSIKQIKVITHNNKVEIYHHNKRDIEIYLDNKLIPLSKFQIRNECYIFDFRNTIKDILILLPDKIYEYIHVKGCVSDMIIGKKEEPIKSKTMDVIVDSGIVNINTKGMDLNINTKTACLYINSILKDLHIQSSSSYINLILNIPFPKGNIDILGTHIRVDAKINDDKIQPKVNKPLKNVRRVIGKYFVGNTELNMNVKTIIGGIKIM